MKGHGRLLRGSTPPERVRLILSQEPVDIASPVLRIPDQGDVLAVELARTRRLLVVAEVVAAVELVALLLLVGFRLAGV